jgi:hypothetical protein
MLSPTTFFLRTQTQLDTMHTYIANIHNEQQEQTDINVPQVRVLTNILKIFLDTEGRNTYCFTYFNSVVN